MMPTSPGQVQPRSLIRKLLVATLVAPTLLAGCGGASGLSWGGGGTAYAAQSESKHVRAIAIGHRINLATAETEQSFAQEMDRLLAEAAQKFDPQGPNLVSFGEGFGVMTAMLGPRYAKVRAAATVGDAFSAIGQIKLPQFLYYKARYGFSISNARALFLSLTDELYTPFTRTYSALAAKYHCYLVACTMVADVDDGSSDPLSGQPAAAGGPQAASDDVTAQGVFSGVHPNSSAVYNTAFFWGPDGRLIGKQHKVHLTDVEQKVVDLTPGSLGDLRVWDTPMGKVGIAICLDGFNKDVVQALDRQGCQILIQPSFNGSPLGGWAISDGRDANTWQPKGWLDATLGGLQPEVSSNIKYWINPMTVGKFFDEYYDGQSSIAMRSQGYPSLLYVGVDPLQNDPNTSKRYHGEFLAMSPWVTTDPRGWVDSSTGRPLALADRLRYLRGAGAELLAGGTHENQFVESVISADLALP